MDWFEQAMADIGAAVDDAVEWVGDAVEDVGEVIEDVVEDIGEFVEDVVEDVVEAAEDVAEWGLNVLDDYVFDPVDYITGGAIDIDYDDGQFSAELDVGIASVGVSFGDQGFSTHAGFDLGLASGEMSYDSASGFAASGSIGLDWGPLPYAEGHIEIGANGDITIGGEMQATLPLPTGFVEGHLEGEMFRRADGSWGATGSTEVNLDTALIDSSFSSAAELDLSREGFEFAADLDASLDVAGRPPLAASAAGDVGVGIVDDSLVVSSAIDVGASAGATSVDASAAIAQQISDLAGSGDLSDALSGDPSAVAEASALVDSGAFDDFTTDIVNVELTEAAADEVWDDIGQ